MPAPPSPTAAAITAGHTTSTNAPAPAATTIPTPSASSAAPGCASSGASGRTANPTTPPATAASTGSSQPRVDTGRLTHPPADRSRGENDERRRTGSASSRALGRRQRAWLVQREAPAPLANGVVVLGRTRRPNEPVGLLQRGAPSATLPRVSASRGSHEVSHTCSRLPYGRAIRGPVGVPGARRRGWVGGRRGRASSRRRARACASRPDGRPAAVPAQRPLAPLARERVDVPGRRDANGAARRAGPYDALPRELCAPQAAAHAARAVAPVELGGLVESARCSPLWRPRARSVRQAGRRGRARGRLSRRMGREHLLRDRPVRRAAGRALLVAQVARSPTEPLPTRLEDDRNRATTERKPRARSERGRLGEPVRRVARSACGGTRRRFTENAGNGTSRS